MAKEKRLDVPEYRLELSKYRLERARENIRASEKLLTSGYANISSSRAYYAVFYALLAVTELDGFESSKHSGVISYFNRNYVRTGTFDPKISKMIASAFRNRRYADYEGLYETSSEDAQKQIDAAEEIISIIQPYLESRWSKMKEE